MLDPNQRTLLTSLLTPPAGMIFDVGLTTTYSLDPLSLLSVPLHLAWLASHDDRAVLADPIRLLEALQRVTARFTVFADRGRILVPGQGNALFALLEETISEVRAPRDGAFHPKVWVLRFVHPEQADDVLLRVAILSRNLTADRCWDLSLVLEGRPAGSYVAANRPLGELIARLPDWVVRPLPDHRRAHCAQLADELRRTKWSLPGEWESVAFHVLGTRRGPWDTGGAHDLTVISPFVSAEALTMLCQGKGRPVALVSRPETLAALPAAARERFERCLILHDAAETEDGEEAPRRDDVGLHAKAVLLRRGWKSHLFVGSANATSAAMVAGMNIEVMAELVGSHSRVGRVESLLDKAALGGVLAEFDPAAQAPAVDAVAAAAEAALEKAQRALARADFTMRCTRREDGNFLLTLCSGEPLDMDAVAVAAWPLSFPAERAVAVSMGAPIDLELAVVDAADVTGLIAFELSRDGQVRRFALNLTVDGLPTERATAILRRVVRNREGFLRYLRLLLGGLVANDPAAGPPVGAGQGAWTQGHGAAVESLLEDMVRAWSREPERLRDVQRVVESLRGESDGPEPIVPPEFEAVWTVFEQALGGPK